MASFVGKDKDLLALCGVISEFDEEINMFKDYIRDYKMRYDEHIKSESQRARGGSPIMFIGSYLRDGLSFIIQNKKISKEILAYIIEHLKIAIIHRKLCYDVKYIDECYSIGKFNEKTFKIERTSDIANADSIVIRGDISKSLFCNV
jgi:hypothetical protein